MDVLQLDDCLEYNRLFNFTNDTAMTRDSDTGYSSNNSSNACSPEALMINVGGNKQAPSSFNFSSNKEAEITFRDDLHDLETQSLDCLTVPEAAKGLLGGGQDSKKKCNQRKTYLSSQSPNLDQSGNKYAKSTSGYVKQEEAVAPKVFHHKMNYHQYQSNETVNNDQAKGHLNGCKGKPIKQQNWQEADPPQPYSSCLDEDFFDKLSCENDNSTDSIDFCIQGQLGNSAISSSNTNERLTGSRKSSCLDDFELLDASVLLLSPESCKNLDEKRPKTFLFDDKFHNRLQDSFDAPPPSKSEDANAVSPPPCDDDDDSFSLKDCSIGSISDSGLMRNSSGMVSSLGGQEDPHSVEDEAWRSYLENPLTAATTAMMSIHGDEDSAAALGILYDYYKVPREKRILSYQIDSMDPSSRRTSPENQEASLRPVSSACDVTFLANETGQRSISHSGSSSLDQDSTFRDVVSVGSDCASTTSHSRSDLLPAPEPATNFINAGDPDVRRTQMTPDSAFSESKDSSPQVLSFNDCTNTYLGCRSRSVGKRLSYPQTRGNFLEEDHLHLTQAPLTTSTISLPTLFGTAEGNCGQSGDMFEYIMEAPKSLKQKDGEPTMSYINKGQFYCITLRETATHLYRPRSTKVTSVVQIVFGDSKPEEEQQRHWKYWHARQHTAKQRIIDIADYKESSMINEIDEFAHNAIAFTWDTSDVAKIFISCNCLSTDFSAQKGIKGLPLLLQIDTYYENRRSGSPAHRGTCQLKVFCDKGAERKIRDEERKVMRKKHKSGMKGPHRMPLSPIDVKSTIHSPSASPSSQTATGQNAPLQKKLDLVYFVSMADRRPAIYFIPENYGSSRTLSTVSPVSRLQPDTTFANVVLTPTSGADVEQVLFSSQLDSFDSLRSPGKRTQSQMSSEDGDFPPSKSPRLWESEPSKKVLLYIRKEIDDVFDALMLNEPSLNGLREAIEEKYNLPKEKISKVLKKSKKGILVNVDDNIVRHYSNEDTFIIDIASDIDDATYKVTLCVV